MKPTYEELEQQLAAVVSENAGLKDAVDIIETKYMNWEGLSDAFSDARGIKTPATDAYLAEVRAQGVEMLCEAAEQLMNEFSDDSYKVMVTGDLQRLASAFAAQLRQGAAL